jgi:hypothetical protein
MFCHLHSPLRFKGRAKRRFLADAVCRYSYQYTIFWARPARSSVSFSRSMSAAGVKTAETLSLGSGSGILLSWGLLFEGFFNFRKMVFYAAESSINRDPDQQQDNERGKDKNPI